ncbi:MAG: SUMF1/EgtB/PvdO family nonheme iron enzyme, partial [Pseudomonadota bacterium]
MTKAPSRIGYGALEARRTAVLAANPHDTMALFRAAGFDLGRDLRFADWSGVRFDGCDLPGCDFTGARLTGCSFAGARIAGARFDRAEVRREQLRAATDWKAHVADWRRPERIERTGHLPPQAVFSDAPFAPEMVVIPAGHFTMGSPESEEYRDDDEGPQREVRFARSFALGRNAVTFEEYEAYCKAKRRKKPDDEGWGRGRRPVINVSCEDAEGYCAWLSGETGVEYRLPSEAEWEYACRAGTTTPFFFGETVSTYQANYDGNYTYGAGVAGEYRKRTVPVDEMPLAENAWGLRHMHGNVYEWCADAWNESYEGAPRDGSVWQTGDTNLAVLRGGSWYGSPVRLRSAD